MTVWQAATLESRISLRVYVIYDVTYRAFENTSIGGSKKVLVLGLPPSNSVFIVCSCHPWGLSLLLCSMVNCGLGFVCY